MEESEYREDILHGYSYTNNAAIRNQLNNNVENYVEDRLGIGSININTYLKVSNKQDENRWV